MNDDDLPEYMFDSFIKRIRSRLHYQNKNYLAIITGATGTGKSYGALSFAYEIAGEQNKVWLVFQPLELIKLINSGNLKKGDVVLMDEIGVGMNAREWQSESNILFGSILQTFRTLNVAVLFTTPDLSFVDIQARKLFHQYMETIGIDYREKVVKMKVFDIQPNPRIGKIYFKKPRFVDDEGIMVKLRDVSFQKPDEKVCVDYEARRKAYTDELNRSAEAKLLKAKAKEEAPKEVKKSLTNEEIIQAIRSNPQNYQNSKGKYTTSLIRNSFDMPEYKAREVRAILYKE